MQVTVDQVGISGGRTSLQFAPASVLTCTSPSSEPTQITLSVSGETAIEEIVSNISSPVTSALIGPPGRPCLLLSLRVRSGLITFQCWPSSKLSNSTLAPNSISLSFPGANTSG